MPSPNVPFRKTVFSIGICFVKSLEKPNVTIKKLHIKKKAIMFMFTLIVYYLSFILGTYSMEIVHPTK